jgi:hypothetical protein
MESLLLLRYYQVGNTSCLLVVPSSYEIVVDLKGATSNVRCKLLYYRKVESRNEIERDSSSRRDLQHPRT